MATEKEYKVAIKHGSDPAVLSLSADIELRMKNEMEQLSEYLDSSSLQLAALGIGLRYRLAGEADGMGEWTMKIPRVVDSGGASLREEIEHRGSRLTVPDDIACVIEGVGIVSELVPTVSVANHRKSFQVALAGRVLPLEVDLDHVVFGDGSEFEELEIELFSLDVDHTARLILAAALDAGGVLSEKTKLERAIERSTFAPMAVSVVPDLADPKWWLDHLGLIDGLLVRAWSESWSGGTVELIASVIWEVAAAYDCVFGNPSALDELFTAFSSMVESSISMSVELTGVRDRVIAVMGELLRGKDPQERRRELSRTDPGGLRDAIDRLRALLNQIEVNDAALGAAMQREVLSISPFRIDPRIGNLLGRLLGISLGIEYLGEAADMALIVGRLEALLGVDPANNGGGRS